MRLLAEVKKAREEVRGSPDKLRGSTPTPSSSALGDTPRAITPTPNLGDVKVLSNHRRLSNVSGRMLDFSEGPKFTGEGDWDTYAHERKVVSPSIGLSPISPAPGALLPVPTRRHSQFDIPSGSNMMTAERRARTTSMLEPRASESGPRGSKAALNTFPSAVAEMRKTMSYQERPSTFHDMSLGQPIILGSAARRFGYPVSARMPQQRTMTYDELADGHRKRISRLQEPVTTKMREEMDVAEAKARWERQKQIEQAEHRRREQDELRRGNGIDPMTTDVEK